MDREINITIQIVYNKYFGVFRRRNNGEKDFTR